MRLLSLACFLFALGGTAAFAQPELHPAAPFYAATPKVQSIVLRDRPGGRALATLGSDTQFGSPETVGVAEARGDWIGVISTSLPNGVLGWVPRKEMNLRPVAWSISISLSDLVLVVQHNGNVVRRVTVGIGAATSPTPVGRYVITDHIDPRAQSDVYGCCIIALSGHQPHPPAGWDPNQDWRLAIHGGATGAISAGCIHADETTLRYLMRMTPLGTPVTVTA
jgi:hypothetical protein